MSEHTDTCDVYEYDGAERARGWELRAEEVSVGNRIRAQVKVGPGYAERECLVDEVRVTPTGRVHLYGWFRNHTGEWTGRAGKRLWPPFKQSESSPDPDTLLRELVREVARRSALAMTEAVAEVSGLHHRDVPRTSTDALADAIHEAIARDPDSPLARVRERMR